jgi:TIR domain-containing protein
MQKRDAIAKLSQLIKRIEPLKQLPRYSTEYKKWERDTEVAIEYVFGEQSRHIKDFKGIWTSPFIVTSSTPDSYFQERYLNGLENSKAILESMIEEIEDYWTDETEKSLDVTPPRRLRVFLCHSSSDKPIVRELFKRLRADGIDAWLDEENILPGQDWQQEINKALAASDVIVVCLSNESISKKGYVQKEIKDILDAVDQQPDGTIFLIPCKLEECNVPDQLKGKQWVNYFEERGYDRLMLALKARGQSLGITVGP